MECRLRCAEQLSGESPPPNPRQLQSQPSSHQEEEKGSGKDSNQLALRSSGILVWGWVGSQEDSGPLAGQAGMGESEGFARPWLGSQCQGAVAEERRRICFEQ